MPGTSAVVRQGHLDRELLKLLPRVLRARDFHLYMEGGKRLTDLWLNGGKAILGHKPPGFLKELKNTAQRGLFSPLPGPLERRILKALEEIFPGRAFRLYPDESSLYRALEKAALQEPAIQALLEPGISLWRPFLEGAAGEGGKGPLNKAPLLIPVLPWPLGPAVLVLDRDTEFPAGEIIPPVILAPAIRSLYELIKAMKEKIPRPMKIEKALKNSNWQRKGIYLFTSEQGEETEPGAGVSEAYAALWKYFLEGGFLLPPSPAEPAILPMSMSPGEEAKLAKLIGGEKN